MGYTVDDFNQVITQNANTTETDLSGLSGLVDGLGIPVVTTAGGGHSGNAGTQKVYTLVHPYKFEIKGNLTITPDIEQLVIENTTQVDDQQDFKISSGGFVTVAGEFTEDFGTFYSPSTWLRINRSSTDSFAAHSACFFIDALGGLDWRGGVAEGAAVFAIEGDNDDDAPSINISNAIWNGLSGDMFTIQWNRKTYYSDAFTIMGNRLVDGRAGVYTFGYVAVNSLIEGSHSQVFENYSGTVEYATWTRSMSDRKFLNTSFGMTLPVTVFTPNKTQQGGLIQVEKSAILDFVDVERNPLEAVKVVVKTYDNGDRINYPALPTASALEAARFTDQTAVSDLAFTTDLSGQVYFTKLLKDYTCRENLTSFDVSLGDITGSFSAGDQISLLESNPDRVDGEFVYHDTTENKMYFRRTRNLRLFYSTFVRMINLTQSGEAIWGRSHLDQNTTNAIARYTKGNDDDNPVGDVMSYLYGKQITSTEVNYSGMNSLESTVFILDDPSITETDSSVVGSYSVLENTNKIYDALALQLYNFYTGQTQFISNFVDGYLDFGTKSVVLDGTQASPLIENGDTYTIGVGTSGRFSGNIKASSVTLVNGATTSGLINSGGVIFYPDRQITLTNVVIGSRIYVVDLTNNVELFNTVTNVSNPSAFVPSDGTDVQLLIKVRNASSEIKYKQFKTEATLPASGLSVQINQQLD